MSKKFDPGLIKEIKEAKAEEDRILAGKLKSIVCNHAAFPHLFHLWTNVDRIKVIEKPPKGMTGYAYICKACQEFMGVHGISKERAQKCFTDMYDFEIEKKLEKLAHV